MIKRTVFFVFGLAFLMPLLASANVLDQIKADFHPVFGVIVDSFGEEYLIDLDANLGVIAGDLFSVVVPGAPVLHPVTGEVLGTLDQVKGYLQVREVRSGYSISRPLSKEGAFLKKDIIQRYNNVKAAFWDYSGDGQSLFASLRAALPMLAWQNYAESQSQRPSNPEPLMGQETPLLFIYHKGELEVRGASFQVLHRYSLEAESLTLPTIATVPTLPTASGVVLPVSESSMSEAVHAGHPSESGIVYSEISDGQGVRTINNLSGDAVGLEVGDFNGDGQLETAVLDQNGVTLYRFTQTGQEKLANIELHQADKYLAIDRADVDGDGNLELYVSAVRELEPASIRLEFREGELKVTQDSIPYFLRAVDLPQEGRILLGQAVGDQSSDFGHDTFRMQFEKSLLAAGSVYSTPWKIQLFGFIPIATTGGELLYANLSTSGHLRISRPDGDDLWKSSQVYGGSQIFFRYPDYSGGAGDSLHDVTIMPRLEAGKDDAILVPSNAGRGFIDQMSDLGPGSIYAMHWDGYAMREMWHTRPQEGCLLDFRLADIDNDGQQELVLLMAVSNSGLFSKGRTALVIYELQ